MIGVFTAICGHAQINSTDFVATWNSLSNNRIFFPASGEYTVYYESLPAGRSGTLPATGTFTGPQTITFPTAGTYRSLGMGCIRRYLHARSVFGNHFI